MFSEFIVLNFDLRAFSFCLAKSMQCTLGSHSSKDCTENQTPKLICAHTGCQKIPTGSCPCKISILPTCLSLELTSTLSCRRALTSGTASCRSNGRVQSELRQELLHGEEDKEEPFTRRRRPSPSPDASSEARDQR